MAHKQGVEPEKYVKSMASMWSRYGMTPNPALQRAWKVMAETLNRHVRGEASEEWSVLGLPTGTGKTQGLAMYCASLQQQPGILIITRFKDAANELAETINSLAEAEIAHARHGDNKGLSIDRLAEFPVLIATHSAYSRVLGGVADSEAEGKLPWSWPMYHHWKQGTRALVVIDETLNTIEPVKVELDDLRLVLGSIPFDVEQQYPKEIDYLGKMLAKLSSYANTADNKILRHLLPLVWQHTSEGKPIVQRDLSPLITALSHDNGHEEKQGQDVKAALAEKNFKRVLRKKQVAVLQNLMDIVTSKSLYARQGKSRAVHMARLALPTHVESAVILDATAAQNYAYNMQGTFIKRPSLPEKIRNYKNVTLHILYGLATGKSSLSEKSPEFYLELIAGLEPSIAGKSVLLCTHKAVKAQFKLVQEKFPKVAIENWGAIDGKNNWQKFDTIVLCGLNHIGPVNSECAVLAYEAWHEKAQHKYNPDFHVDDETMTWQVVGDDDGEAHNDYERSHITVSVIQAINRVRCRKSVDTAGNCAKTDVHLYLRRKDGVLEQHILERIRQAMPGIQVVESEVSIAAHPEKLSAQETAIIQFFTKMKKGEYSPKQVLQLGEARGIKGRTLERALKEINDNPDSIFSHTAREAGVTYLRGGRGRYSTSRVKKA